MKIVCDTNIWYHLGDGSLDSSIAKEHCLVSTFYNFEELNTTPKTVENFQLVRAAAEAIVDFSCHQILENAILYLARLIDKHFEDKKYLYNLGMRNWNEIRSFKKLPNNFVLTPELIAMYSQNITNRVAESQYIANLENNLANAIKKNARKDYKANKEKYFISSAKGIVALLNKFLSDVSEGNAQLTPDFDISQIEFFFHVFVHFFKRVEIDHVVVKPNDAYDLYNMIYVQPGMKYFTMETRWKQFIKEAGFEDYLFEV